MLHKHVWAFDWENPPGYLCSIDGCGAIMNACKNCEGPSHHEFCSELCASEHDAFVEMQATADEDRRKVLNTPKD